MKSKAIPVAVILIFVTIGMFFYFKILEPSQHKTPIHSIDDKGIYVGGKSLGLEPVPDGRSRYASTVKALNEGWEYIRLGDSYDTAGQYEKAIQAYKKAYEVDPRNGLMSGKILIRLYEKLSRYDEALLMVDDILKTQPLGTYGKEQYAIIRARLLAAKSQLNRN